MTKIIKCFEQNHFVQERLYYGEHISIFEFMESSESCNGFTRTFYGHAMEQSKTFHRLKQCNINISSE